MKYINYFTMTMLFSGLSFSCKLHKHFPIRQLSVIQIGILDQTSICSVSISISEDSPDFPIYREIHDSVLTNSIGLINLAIGAGTPTASMFEEIDWANHSFFNCRNIRDFRRVKRLRLFNNWINTT